MLGGSRAHSDREIAAAAPRLLKAPGVNRVEDAVAHRRAASQLLMGAMMANDIKTAVAQRAAATEDATAVAHRHAATKIERAPGEAWAAQEKTDVAHRRAATNKRRYRGCRGKGKRLWRRRQVRAQHVEDCAVQQHAALLQEGCDAQLSGNAAKAEIDNEQDYWKERAKSWQQKYEAVETSSDGAANDAQNDGNRPLAQGTEWRCRLQAIVEGCWWLVAWTVVACLTGCSILEYFNGALLSACVVACMRQADGSGSEFEIVAAVQRKPNARTLTKRWIAVTDRMRAVTEQRRLRSITVDWRAVVKYLKPQAIWAKQKEGVLSHVEKQHERAQQIINKQHESAKKDQDHMQRLLAEIMFLRQRLDEAGVVIRD